MSIESSNRNEDLLAGTASFVLYALLALLLALACDYRLPEAVVHRGIASDLLAGASIGRQAAVCSVWWPPAGTLLQIPFLPLRAEGAETLVAAGAACLAASLCLVFLNKALRLLEVHRPLRWLLVFLFFAQPHLAFSAAGGDAAAMHLLCWTAFIYFFLRWSREFEVRDLLCMSLAMGASILALHQGMFTLLLTSLLVVAVVHVRRGAGRAEKEAVLLSYLAPGLYIAAVWAVFNRVIMGDLLYFLRGTYIGPVFMQDITSGGPAAGPRAWHTVALLLGHELRTFPFFFIGAAGLVLLFARYRDRECAWLALLAVPPLLSLVLMHSRSQLADPLRQSLVFLPLGFVFFGKLLRAIGTRKSPLSYCATALLFLIVALPLSRWPDPGRARGPAADPFSSSTYQLATDHLSGQTVARENRLAAMTGAIESAAGANGEDGRKILVFGFSGYQVLHHARRRDLYLHMLEPRFDDALEGTQGKDLYALVPAPQGTGAFEPLNLQLPGLYRRGSRETIIWTVFENWHLYRVIRSG